MSNTPDPSVTGRFTGAAFSPVDAPTTVTNGPEGTEVSLGTEPLTLGVTRALGTQQQDASDTGVRGHVTARRRRPDGAEQRGRFFVLRDPSL